MSKKDEHHPGTAELSDIPAGVKKILTWLWVLYSDRPLWQKPLIGSFVFVLGIAISPEISEALALLGNALTVVFGSVSFSMNQAILVMAGVIAGVQIRMSKQLNSIGEEIADMSGPATAPDGGRTLGDGDDGGSSGGGAVGGAIAGAALGSSFGPGGTIGAAVLGAILGDELEKHSDDWSSGDNQGRLEER